MGEERPGACGKLYYPGMGTIGSCPQPEEKYKAFKHQFRLNTGDKGCLRT